MDINNQYGALEAQKKLLDLLKAFHSFCKANDIKYSLDCGSLLGAVRHKGFIPWDDDLDIMVDRQNFAKIILRIKENDILTIDDESPETIWVKRIRFANRNSTDSFLPTIDMFVMDYASNNKYMRKLMTFLVLFLQGMIKVSPNFRKGNVILRFCTVITYCLGKLISRNTKLKWYDSLALWYADKRDHHFTCYFEEYNYLGRYFRSDLFENISEVEFEDTEVYVVKECHEFLRIQYGPDYMTPPQMSERILRHQS